MNDLFGKALFNYHQKPSDQKIITWTNLTDEDPVPLSYFFRPFDQMPQLEKKALELSYGKVLDIGCGSGSHSLYLQNQKKLDVIGLDISEGAIAVASSRGLKKTIHTSIFDFSFEKFDTLLLLMNGLGIASTTSGVVSFLEHLKKLLQPKGQILVDSSDLVYLFDEEDKNLWLDDERYYGEVDYGIGFNGHTATFPWLYLDFIRLQKMAKRAGFRCNKVCDGTHYDYLACLKPTGF